MEIWLIQNGKKTGPFNDYEIRDRISNQLLDSDDYAWHEGLPSWVKLQEIDLFKSLFRKICGLKLASERFRSARSSWKLPTTGRFENGSDTRRRSGLLWATSSSSAWWVDEPADPGKVTSLKTNQPGGRRFSSRPYS
ncbi:MAG: DUF4339 domain-containing protein, partial [Akkermansiaceae bacterium]